MADEEKFPLDQAALIALAAWNGVSVEQMPPEWWFAPGNGSREAWNRVTRALKDHFAPPAPASIKLERSEAKITATCSCGWKASARFDAPGEMASTRIDREVAAHERRHALGKVQQS